MLRPESKSAGADCRHGEVEAEGDRQATGECAPSSGVLGALGLFFSGAGWACEVLLPAACLPPGRQTGGALVVAQSPSPSFRSMGLTQLIEI
mmetsp:Transcript_75377/g.224717  ORF Transcript_75377/g.224717 Transcript_75377/m.224717 type:complete len:92 (+) Transcript_75377:753-1028(+)